MSKKNPTSDLAAIALKFLHAEPELLNMTLRQLAVLGVICDHEGPHRNRTLAPQIQASTPVITRIMQTLSALGLCERYADLRDRRDCYYLPTEKGRGVRARMGAMR